MRIALFSDIHGNLTGLQAVLAAIPRLGGADAVIAAGDLIVGESATDEILEVLQAQRVQLIRGDSDTEDKLIRLEHQALRAPGTTRNPLAYYRAMQTWLAEHLSPDGRAFLASLPTSLTLEAAPERYLYVCHASPRGVDDRVCAPQCDAANVRAAFGTVQADVIAFGHAHTPFVRLLDGRLYVNVASVGFRPDGVSRLTLLTYTEGHWLVEQHGIPYDVAAETRRKEQYNVPIPNP